MKAFYIALLFIVAAVIFFLTRELYRPEPEKIPVPMPPKIEYITKEIPVPKPYIVKGDVDTVWLPADDSLLAGVKDSLENSPDSLKHEKKAVVAKDSLQIIADKDTLALKTEYYFPPINRFRHTVTSYKKTTEKITEYVPVETMPQGWKRIRPGVGIGAAIDTQEWKLRPTNIVIGLFYFF
ncbi:MAG TPA: hypothetical protein VHO03_16870 [Ignavibacteriales bacterium]|nr:hypothetical protein [Ignavibacteriales bacterium]